ncbi:hypothetical protein V9T40_006025 [Parthenolecanium corni]|uniref:CCHC-type domain-containing protein n=1 Tax=Parthenolecanium corni TaxID=536013 RepID=A0AAN9TT58_9HEMI
MITFSQPFDVFEIPLPIGPPSKANFYCLSGPSEEVLVEPDILLDTVILDAECPTSSVVGSEASLAEEVEPAPQPHIVVCAKIHEPLARASTPLPSTEDDIGPLDLSVSANLNSDPRPLFPANLPRDHIVLLPVLDRAAEVVPPSPDWVEIIELSDDNDLVMLNQPIVVADAAVPQPPVPAQLPIIDLAADEDDVVPVAGPSNAVALVTPPIRHHVPCGPPPLLRHRLGPRCFNYQRRGHHGNRCPYPPAVGRPCFNCGRQGYEIANRPDPAH